MGQLFGGGGRAAAGQTYSFCHHRKKTFIWQVFRRQGKNSKFKVKIKIQSLHWVVGQIFGSDGRGAGSKCHNERKFKFRGSIK